MHPPSQVTILIIIYFHKKCRAAHGETGHCSEARSSYPKSTYIYNIFQLQNEKLHLQKQAEFGLPALVRLCLESCEQIKMMECFQLEKVFWLHSVPLVLLESLANRMG